MPKIPIQDEVYDVTHPIFQDYLLKWVMCVKNLDIETICHHGAGLADFKGTYSPMMFELIFRQSKIIEQEIQSNEILLLFLELVSLTDKVWKFEQDIIEEYARVVNVDIAIGGNRKKLENKVYKYRFGDTSQGINMIVPENIVEIGSHSVELIPFVEKIATNLIAEIDKMPSN